jgi:hypothetical protein
MNQSWVCPIAPLPHWNPSHDLEALKSRKTSTPCRLQMWEIFFHFLKTITLPWVVWESLMDFKASFSFHGRSYEENGGLFGMLAMMDHNHGLQYVQWKMKVNKHVIGRIEKFHK